MRGRVWSGGVWSCWGWLWTQGAMALPPPATREQTGVKNITFPQLRLWAVKIFQTVLFKCVKGKSNGLCFFYYNHRIWRLRCSFNSYWVPKASNYCFWSLVRRSYWWKWWCRQWERAVQDLHGRYHWLRLTGVRSHGHLYFLWETLARMSHMSKLRCTSCAHL